MIFLNDKYNETKFKNAYVTTLQEIKKNYKIKFG